MNRKGFTLIELLATIAILAIIGGIATISVISTINNSKLKSEQVFIEKISNLIDDYLDLNPPTKSVGETISFEKCKDANCSEKYTVTATLMKKNVSTGEDDSIYIKDLITANLVESDQLVNPKNKEQCFISANPEIIVYKDSDYVYHYYVDLKGTNTDCDISDENGFINILPDNLKSKVGLEWKE